MIAGCGDALNGDAPASAAVSNRLLFSLQCAINPEGDDRRIDSNRMPGLVQRTTSWVIRQNLLRSREPFEQLLTEQIVDRDESLQGVDRYVIAGYCEDPQRRSDTCWRQDVGSWPVQRPLGNSTGIVNRTRSESVV